MKVLVTGGCGLIGYHTAVHYKEQGHEVHVMDNLERSDLLGHKVSGKRLWFNKDRLAEQDITTFFLDVSEPRSFEGLDDYSLIVHLAGQCGVPTSIENPTRDFEVNVIGTRNVLEFARTCGATVIFASTNKVYPIHDCFIQEEDRWHFMNPQWDAYGVPTNGYISEGSRTPYGWSKYAADLLCQEYYHTYGVRTGVFRMSCIYGPNQFGFEEQGWATWFVIATEKGLPLTIYGDGNQARDMLYVKDCVKAYDAFFQSPEEHGVYNLGGGPDNTITLIDSLDKMYHITGKKSDITFEHWRPSDQKVYISDIRELDYRLHWKPEVSIDQGLKEVHSWVKENIDVF